MKWDTVVIGGGLAGLSAALRGAELGLRVALLEQGDQENYKCNSRFSGGILHVCYRDVKRPASELLQFILEATSNDVQMTLAEAIASDAGRYLEWLQSHGARFMRFSQLEAHKWCMAPPRALKAGMDWEGRGPDVTMRMMASKFRELGGQLFLKTRARSLKVDGDRCVGVVSEDGSGSTDWLASAVVICDGGFQSNRLLFEQNIGPNFDRVLQRGAANAKGDGLLMAKDAGAALTRRDRFYGHLLSRDAFENDNVWPYPELDAIAMAGLVVGSNGQRFLDEGMGGIAMANALARQENPASATLVFDENIWIGPGRSARIPANPLLEKAGGKVFKAKSVAELAGLSGLPVTALEQTVAAHNSAINGASFDRLEPPRSVALVKPLAIEAAPFYAIPVCPGITHTMGGVAIDGNCRVLDEDNAPIKGLFAAGASTGGLEGGGSVGYVSGLVKAGVFGIRAAEQIHRDCN